MKKSLFFLASLVALSFTVQASSSSIPKETDVVIVGAGLSGLASAYYLKKEGYKVHVLEITPRVGGRVRTAHYEMNGQRLSADAGMEEYWESNPAVGLLKELKLPVTSDVAISSIVVNKTLFGLGDEDRPEFLKKIMGDEGFQKFNQLSVVIDPILHEIESGKISEKTMKLKDISFAEWVKKQGLPNQVQDWIRVTVECEVGTEWDSISALDGIDEIQIFIGEGEKCYRVTGGNEKFTEAIAKAVGSSNISVNQRVTRVDSSKEGVTVYFTDQKTSLTRSIKGKHVVLTVPLYRLAMEIQFNPPLSQKKNEAIASQTWGAYFKPHVFLKPTATRFWTKGENTILPILTDSELGVIYDGNPDQEGKIKILSLLISGAHANDFNFAPVDLTRKRIVDGLEKLWPGIKAEILGMEFHRYHPRAIAAWAPGRSRFDELSNAVRTPENRVYLAGDFTESSHSSGSFDSALRVTKQIMSADGKKTAAK